MYIDHLILSLSSSSLDEHMEGNNIDNNHDVREKKLEVREKRGKLLIENWFFVKSIIDKLLANIIVKGKKINISRI